MSEDLATLNDVDIYIRDIKYMINNNAKLILSNREKNIIFCENNNIKTNDIKHILLNLKREDFCKILNNRSINSLEKLYLFAPSIKDKNGKCMQLYIKIKRTVLMKVQDI